MNIFRILNVCKKKQNKNIISTILASIFGILKKWGYVLRILKKPTNWE